jgi:hypothetical protein
MNLRLNFNENGEVCLVTEEGEVIENVYLDKVEHEFNAPIDISTFDNPNRRIANVNSEAVKFSATILRVKTVAERAAERLLRET